MAEKSPVVALLSIKPVYANAILDGRKKVEFRKRPFKRPVSHVVIYATAPVQRIVGWFKTGHMDEMPPKILWSKHSKIGGISEDAFHTYYGHSERGVAIHVKQTHRLSSPVLITRISGSHPPQSFSYLPSTAIELLNSLKSQLPAKRHAAKRKKSLTGKRKRKPSDL